MDSMANKPRRGLRQVKPKDLPRFGEIKNIKSERLFVKKLR